MALWGNSDNVGSAGTVWLNYTTGVVTGSGTTLVVLTVLELGILLDLDHVAEPTMVTL